MCVCACVRVCVLFPVSGAAVKALLEQGVVSRSSRVLSRMSRWACGLMERCVFRAKKESAIKDAWCDSMKPQ